MEGKGPDIVGAFVMIPESFLFIFKKYNSLTVQYINAPRCCAQNSS